MSTTYVTSPNGITFLKNHEGCRLAFYADSKGYPTVGWGHLITTSFSYTPNTTLTQTQANALKAALGLDYSSPISQAKADSLLAIDLINKAENYVNAMTIPSGVYAFSQSQFDALVSLTFNCGPGVLQTNDVVNMIFNVQIYPNFPYSMTPAECDSCSKLVSKAFSYDVTLKPRRNDEATLFCTGERYTHKYPVYTL